MRYDGIDPVGEELLVVLGGDGEGALFEPCGRPCDCVEEHPSVLVESFWILFMSIEALVYLVKDALCWEGVFSHHFV